MGGLKELKLKVQKNGAEPTKRLPTAATCYNTLLIPQYSGQGKLENLLKMAINGAAGFGLE